MMSHCGPLDDDSGGSFGEGVSVCVREGDWASQREDVCVVV